GPPARAPCPTPPPGCPPPASSRLRKRTQLRGGARRQHASRTLCTVSVLPRAPTNWHGRSPPTQHENEVACPCTVTRQRRHLSGTTSPQRIGRGSRRHPALLP